MPDVSLREVLRLLRCSGPALLIRAALFAGVGLSACAASLGAEALCEGLMEGEAGRAVGFLAGLAALLAVLLMAEALPVAALVWAPVAAMVICVHGPSATVPGGAALRAMARGEGGLDGDLRRLRRGLRRVVRDVFGLVQGLPAALPVPARKGGTAGRLWLRLTGWTLGDLALADLLGLPAAERGRAAQLAAVRLAEAARPLVGRACRPVAAVAVAAALVALALWPAGFAAARAVPGGVDLLTGATLAAALALQLHRGVGEPLLAAILLPGGLGLLHAEEPNPHWAARLETSSPAYAALAEAGRPGGESGAGGVSGLFRTDDRSA